MPAALSIKRQHFFRITRNFLALLSTFFIVGLFVFRLCFISNKREMRQSLKERKGKNILLLGPFLPYVHSRETDGFN